jgi:cytochrome P450
MDADEIPFLDLANPQFSIRSQAVRDARARSWYARTPYGLAVLRHSEVGSLLRDARLRQGSYKWPAHNRASGLFVDWWLRMVLNRVGEDHSRLRRLGNPAFAPKVVTPLIPRFEAIAHELIEGFVPRGRCEFMGDFAEPYATRVICELLGLAHSNWRALADAAADMGLALGVTYNQNQDKVNAATQRMFDYAHQVVEERRRNPRDDFVSNLIAANAEERLADDELLDMVVLAIFGGIDTTRNQLGLGMSMFIDNTAQWELLAAHPEYVKGAVEEVMRMRPTTTWVTREALDDIEFKGVRIAKGTTVHIFAESAGTDPAVFSNELDITQERKSHYGFGAGPHHCMGHFIARADMAEAFRLLSQRLTGLAYDADPVWLPDSGNTGPVSLPIGFKARG